MTVEAPLKLAQDLLAGKDTDPAKAARLKDAEIWIVPCVNPDGYEYTRNGEVCRGPSMASEPQSRRWSALYLNSVDSDETQEANNIISFCFEIGSSFQPKPSLIPQVTTQTSSGLQGVRRRDDRP